MRIQLNDVHKTLSIEPGNRVCAYQMVVIIRCSMYEVLWWALELQRDQATSALGKVSMNSKNDKLFIESCSSSDRSTEERVTNAVRVRAVFREGGVFQWGFEGWIRIHHVKGGKDFPEEGSACMKTQRFIRNLSCFLPSLWNQAQLSFDFIPHHDVDHTMLAGLLPGLTSLMDP